MASVPFYNGRRVGRWPDGGNGDQDTNGECSIITSVFGR
jgi:hypothetical protein